MGRPARYHAEENGSAGAAAAQTTGDKKPKPKNQNRKRKVEVEELDLKIGEKMAKYKRGDRAHAKGLEDKKLKSNIKKTEKKFHEAAYRAARAETLLPEEAGMIEAEGMERTWRFKQNEIKDNVDIRMASKMFDLKLPQFGPYQIDFSRNGRYLTFAGNKGHVAILDWQRKSLVTEFHLQERTRAVKFLHNDTFIATAQKKYVYIYDNSGLEIHRLHNHIEPLGLEFLPYHFLLVSVGNAGFLKYHDTSTGSIVGELRTKLGPCHVIRQNPANAVINLGHGNGTVTMWTPNMSTPAVKMLCHKAPLTAIAVNPTGEYMVTGGMDGLVRVWDNRMYKVLHSYYTTSPAEQLDISQRGLLTVGYRNHIQVWKDALSSKADAPYLNHNLSKSQVCGLRFCPYEDILGVGHATGFSSLAVPGSGEPNFDSWVANPFETSKQRQEAEVHALLDKLQPEMITLDPTKIGTVDAQIHRELAKQREEERKIEEIRKAKGDPENTKHKARGRNSSKKRHRKKQQNVLDLKKHEIEQAARKEEKKKKKQDDAPDAPQSLARFL